MFATANSFRVAKNLSRHFLPQGFKANPSTPRGMPARGPRPGLKLANAFSVRFQKTCISLFVIKAGKADSLKRFVSEQLDFRG